MADLATANDKLIIPGIGHVFYSEVDAAEMSIDAFKFTDSSTWGTWKWLGDTSSENLIEFESDGGDITYKRTWDRSKVRAIREDTTYTATINSVSISKEVMEIAFPGGRYNPASKKFTVPSNPGSSEKALMVVMEDGTNIAAFRFPNVDIAGSFPTLDLEEFMEIPLSVAILSSPTTGDLWELFEARPYAATDSDD